MAKFSNWSHENLAKFAQAATQKMMERPMTDALKMVQEQAEDAALWCKAATATEAHLQQALRWLHYAVEQSQADRAELLEAQEPAEPVAWLEEAAWGRSLHLTKPDYGQAKWRAPEPKLTPLYNRVPAPKLTPLYTRPTGEPTP